MHFSQHCLVTLHWLSEQVWRWSMNIQQGRKESGDKQRRAGGEDVSTAPWGPSGRCWNPVCVSTRHHESQRTRLRALEAEACACCTTPEHFSLFCSLWFWKKPSFRGTPWDPSGKVSSPGDADTAHYDQPHMILLTICPYGKTDPYSKLTITFYTSIFEFSFKLHAIIPTEDAGTMKLSMRKFSFIPDDVKTEQCVICSFWLRAKGQFLFTLTDRPGSINKDKYSRAMEESILKLAGVAGCILKLELTNTVPSTWKVAHHQNEWELKLQTDDGKAGNPVKAICLKRILCVLMQLLAAHYEPSEWLL